MTAIPEPSDARSDMYTLAREFYIWSRVSERDLNSRFPMILESGKGVRVRDVDGNEYVDLMSGASRASTLGYGDERMADAVHAQLLELHYAGTSSITSEPTIRLAARLAELPPPELTNTVFTSSGTEANEAALKLARLYQHASGKPRAFKVISRWDDYHGSGGGPQEASDWLGVRVPAEPGPPGFSRIPAPTCYRCPFSLEYPSCNLRCADFLADHIEHEGPELVAAFLVEPIAQANGVQVPPAGYLDRVQEICRRYDVVFIADEIITGFGRTGEWFSIQHWGIEPDIITMAKGITAGYVPLAATTVRDEIREALNAFPDVHTFGGHPAAARAALTAIEIYERDGLLDRAKELGEQMLSTLKELEHLDAVGDVRGLGLWAAVDFTSDPETRAPLPAEVLRAIVMRARALGVLVTQNGTAIELAPPFVITPEELRDGLATFERAVREVVQETAAIAL
jgi:adenosylmethionine-8-amino-7-oxononanoate aminotransferase